MMNETWMDDIGTEVMKNNPSIASQTTQITSDTEANKQLILSILQKIDFFKSRLPKEFLGKKTHPQQLYGDFQLKIYRLIEKMKMDTSEFEMDITEIDRYLFLMAKILAGAVESGCQGTAAAARKCLSIGFLEVRTNCLVLHDDDSRRQYLEKSLDYLNNCYLYISVKNMMDITQQNLQSRKKSMQEESQRLEEDKDNIADMLIASPELFEQTQAVLHTTFLQAGHTWSASVQQLYEMLLQLRISGSKLQYEGLLLDIETKKMFFYQDVANKLNSLITAVPTPEDVNLMEKFRNIVSSSVEESERVDQNTVRLDDTMQEFESSLHALPFGSNRQSHFMAKTYQHIEETTEARRKKQDGSGEEEGVE